MVTREGSPYIDTIKQRIATINWIFVLISFVVLILVVRFIYKFLDYLPNSSALTLMTAIALLSVMSFFIMRGVSKRAVSAIEEYGQKIEGLLEITRKIHNSGFSDTLLKDVLETSIRLTRADGGTLFLLEDDELVFKIVIGPSSGEITGLRIPLSEGIVGWVVSNRETVMIGDARKDIRFFAQVDGETGFNTVSILCVPLMSGIKSRAVGAIELISGKTDAFGSADEDVMLYFANQSAAVVERTKLLEDMGNYEIHLSNILAEAIELSPEKRAHTRRVAKYALIMAGAMGLAEERKKALYRAAILHDIGFLKIRKEDVKAPQDYKRHPKLGYEMLKPISFYTDIIDFILHHHECYDGGGYPDGLRGESIPLEARIIAIAEAFDVMVSQDSYKNVGKMISTDFNQTIVVFDEALKELKGGAGTQFDPELVRLFVENITEDDLI